MARADPLRFTKIALANGSGVIACPWVWLTDPRCRRNQAGNQDRIGSGISSPRLRGTLPHEDAVGDAMQAVFKAGAIQREDVFVTTKLWNNNHRPERVKPAFEASRRRLRLDYVDCYLIHTPFAFQPGDEQDPKDERGRALYESCSRVLGRTFVHVPRCNVGAAVTTSRATLTDRRRNRL
jgi:hypothetical protein